MMLDVATYNRYKAIIENAMQSDGILSDFEETFTIDFKVKIDKYKRDTYISEAQSEVFDRMEKKLREGLGPDYEE